MKKETDLQILRRTGGQFYCQVYRMIKELKKDFTLKSERVGGYLFIQRMKGSEVTGSYKFAIVGIKDTQSDWQTQEILFRLLDMPLLKITEDWQGHYIVEPIVEFEETPPIQIIPLSKVMYISTKGELKTKQTNFVTRLRKVAAYV